MAEYKVNTISIYIIMNYSFYASLLELCENSTISQAPSSPVLTSRGPLTPVLSSPSYTFLADDSSLYLLILGSAHCFNHQLSIKETPHTAFKALQDLVSLRQKYLGHKVIGIGYSSGASIMAALADICKDIEAYCFNPVGLGKTATGLDFYQRYSLSDQKPNVSVIRTEADTLSKHFLPPNPEKITVIQHSPKLHPHSLQNFIDNFEINLRDIGKIFPTISQISFSPATGFLLVETTQDLGNYYIEGDIATIFYMVYTYPGQFSFTLVPADKYNPSGPYQLKFFVPEELESTLIGHYLWEADWKLKQLDQGCFYDDLTRQRIPITAEIPWFKSGFDFYSEVSQERSFVRLWFVNEKVDFSYANSEHKGVTIQPGPLKIRVEARKLVQDSEAEFGLSDTDLDHTSVQFAKYLTDHFDELCTEIPELQKLKQIASLVSMAEFFRDTLKIPKDMMNLDLLKSRMPVVEDFYEKGKVPRLSRSEERVEGDFIVKLVVTGGVSLISQSKTQIHNADLIDYLDRSSEYLTPFQITHFDYMRELLEYVDTPGTRGSSASLYAVSLFTPQCCSEEFCNSMVLVDCGSIESSDLSQVYEQLSPYSYLGKLFCKMHHPFRCSRNKCRKVIMPGQAYAQLQIGKFHGECLVCEYCGKAVVNKFVVKEGFYHVECLMKANSEEGEGREGNDRGGIEGVREGREKDREKEKEKEMVKAEAEVKETEEEKENEKEKKGGVGNEEGLGVEHKKVVEEMGRDVGVRKNAGDLEQELFLERKHAEGTGNEDEETWTGCEETKKNQEAEEVKISGKKEESKINVKDKKVKTGLPETKVEKKVIKHKSGALKSPTALEGVDSEKMTPGTQTHGKIEARPSDKFALQKKSK